MTAVTALMASFTTDEQATLVKFEIPDLTVARRNTLGSVFPQFKGIITRYTEAEVNARLAELEAQKLAAAEYASKTHVDLVWNGETITVPVSLLEYIALSKASLDGNNDYNNTKQFPAMYAFKQSVDEHRELLALATEVSLGVNATRERIEESLTA